MRACFCVVSKITAREVPVRINGSLPVMAMEEISFGPRIRDTLSTGKQSC